MLVCINTVCCKNVFCRNRDVVFRELFVGVLSFCHKGNLKKVYYKDCASLKT